jgi:predicted RND superfamily exporter protein
MTTEELFNFLYGTVQHDPRFSPLLGEDAKAALSDAKEALAAGKAQLVGEHHSRMVITTKYPDEDEETFRFIDRLSSACDETFKEKYYLIGNSAMNLEMSRSFGSEYLFITILTAVVIFLIVLLSTRSFMIPLILVLIVQTGVFITVASIGLFGNSIYYLALLIVQCILMGATIDYGILFTNYYTENRRNAGKFEAVSKAYEGAIHTITTSGLILVIVPSVVGRFFQDPTITAIVDTIALGSLAAIALILVFLPGILISFDKLMVRKQR